MSHDPLALPEILAGLPDAADYEMVYAAVMATERGRRFLANYAERNRNADTNMLVGAVARVEAAIRGEPSAQSSAGLKEIAAAIARINAVLAADKASNIQSAIEQIQDIAFVLHERPVEQSLCDALDNAVREIANAQICPDGAAEGVRKAVELLHALAGRVNAMITPSKESADASVDGAADPESFAAAIAALAIALPSLSDTGVPDVVASNDARARTESESGPQSAEVVFPDNAVIETLAELHDRAGHAPDTTRGAPQLSENILASTLEGNPFSRDQAANGILSATEQSNDNIMQRDAESPSVANEVPPSNEMLPTQSLPLEEQSFLPEAMVSPEEDPGDLFEPMPVPTPLAAEGAEETEHPSQAPPQRHSTIPASHAIRRPAASDPLAAVRALSAEELIALFS